MRFIVDVTSIGKSDKETFCVEAESWQKALQQTRALRNDSGPMSGFSIELLDDGCRAVDPMSRLRYDVRRTRDDAPLTAGAAPSTSVKAAAPAAKSVPPAAAAAPVAPPRPTSNPPPAAPVAKRVTTKTAMMGSGAAILQQSVEAPAPVAPPPPAIPRIDVVPQHAPPPAAVPIAAHAPAPVHAPAPMPPLAATPSAQVVFKREHDATDALPMTYREYVYAVGQGTDDGTAERVLRAQLDQVRASISAAPPGKLVQLAVFDAVYKGKPPVPPLATLTWKDWRGEPVIAWPRRPGYLAPSATSAAAPAVAAPIAQPTPTPSQAMTPDAPTPIAAVAHVAPAFVPAAAQVPVPAPIAHAPAPQQQPQPAPAFPAPHPVMPPEYAQTFVDRPSAPIAAAKSTRRMRGDELIADLFEAMHDLHFLRDAVEGGDFCLVLALEKLPAHAGVVHLYDIDKREFIVTSTRGNITESLLLRRHPEHDPLLSGAMRKRRAVVVADATQGETAGLARYGAMGAAGGVKSVMVAPVMQSGRFLGAIELVNPADGTPWTEDDGNALSYIAEQYAEFIAAHGVVTDPERITAAHAQAQAAPPHARR